MIDYKVVHNVKELKEQAKEGYEFVAIITPHDWLMEKREKLPVAPLPLSSPVQPVPMPPFNPTVSDPVLPNDPTSVPVGVDAKGTPEITNVSKVQRTLSAESVKPQTIKQIKDGKDSNTKSTR